MTLPVLGGISGSNSTISNMGRQASLEPGCPVRACRGCSRLAAGARGTGIHRRCSIRCLGRGPLQLRDCPQPRRVRKPKSFAGFVNSRLLNDQSIVRATTQFSTLAAPARLSTFASSASVAPVVMTSSTTATRAPFKSVLQANAPCTLLAR